MAETSKPSKSATWLHKGKPMKASKKFVITSDKTEHKLEIKDITLTDAGDYTFKASETEESTVSLTVAGKH